MNLIDFAELAGSTYGGADEYHREQHRKRREQELNAQTFYDMSPEGLAWRDTLIQSGRIVPDRSDIMRMRMKAEQDFLDMLLRL